MQLLHFVSTSFNLEIHNMRPFFENSEVHGNLLRKSLMHSWCLIIARKYYLPNILMNYNIRLLILTSFQLSFITRFYCVHQCTCKMLTHTLHIINPWTPHDKQFMMHWNIFVININVARIYWIGFQWKRVGHIDWFLETQCKSRCQLNDHEKWNGDMSQNNKMFCNVPHVDV
jgi:hypothetical protein